jgi:hypothetical protein
MVLTANEIHSMSVKKFRQLMMLERNSWLFWGGKKYDSFHGELLDVRAAMCLKDPEPQNQLHI